MFVGWSYGAVGFLRSRGAVHLSLTRRATPPSAEHNLADYRWGPTLSASSYYRDPSSHHHPVFLVDGQKAPSLIEKWTSAPDDAEPWVEISWAAPRTVSRVVVQHAGAHENVTNLSNYTLRCLSDTGPSVALEVKDNERAIAEHRIACRAATGLRAEWHLTRRGDSARVYEIEVWGQ